MAPVNGDGHEWILNQHGFGEAGWKADAEEHRKGGEEQPSAK